MTWKKLNKAKDTAIDLTNLLTLLLPVAEEKKKSTRRKRIFHLQHRHYNVSN